MQLQYMVAFPSKPILSLCLTQFPSYAIRNKLQRFHSFAGRPPGLERLLTDEFPRNFLLVLLTLPVFALNLTQNGSLLGASNCEMRLLASSCMSVRLYALTEFHETWYLNIFQMSVRKIQFSCKSDKKNGSLTSRLADIYY